MADPTGDLRLIKIESVKRAHGGVEVYSSTYKDNMFDRIRVLDCGFLEYETNGDLNSVVGSYLFINISKVKSNKKVATARPHKSGEIGIISPRANEKETIIKILPAEFKQGDNKAKLGSKYVRTNSPAPVTADGEVEMKINTDRETYTVDISGYESPPPSVGDIVDAQVVKVSNLSRGTVVDSNISYRIDLEESAPHTGIFQIEITDDDHPIQGKITRLCSPSVSVGDLIEHNIKTRRTTHKVSNKSIDFEIELEKKPIATGDVTIEATDSTSRIRGKVIKYHSTPKLGEIITLPVETSARDLTVTHGDTNYEIEIEGPIWAGGEVDVEINSESPPFQAEIISYNENLPEVGEQFEVSLEQRPSGVYGTTSSDTLLVNITNGEYRDGRANVEITRSSKQRIQAKILDHVNTTQVKRQKSDNPFSDDGDNMNNLLK